MTMYDIVIVHCPQCAQPAEFKSESGRCMHETFSLDEAPDAVLIGVNQHAPITCVKCAAHFAVEIGAEMPPRTLTARSVVWKGAR